MPRTKDYKKLAEKLQKEVVQLKQQLKTQFQKGIDFAQKEAEKVHAAFDKHIAKATAEFHKKFKTKSKKAAPKKTATKKTTPKAKTTKIAKSKTAATTKRRGRPAKKKGVTKSE